MNQRDTRNKYRATVRESKSKIYRAWKTKETYKKFEELQETYLEGRWQLEDRLAAFWKAYCTMATEHGLVEGVEVPEEYKGEIKLAPQEEEESLEELVNKSETTNIVETSSGPIRVSLVVSPPQMHLRQVRGSFLI